MFTIKSPALEVYSPTVLDKVIINMEEVLIKQYGSLMFQHEKNTFLTHENFLKLVEDEKLDDMVDVGNYIHLYYDEIKEIIENSNILGDDKNGKN